MENLNVTSVICSECKAFDWNETDLPCDTCGDHQGFICQKCFHCVDAVWDEETYNLISESLEQSRLRCR